MRRTGVADATDGIQRYGGLPMAGRPQRRRRRRTMGLCAHCHRPVEFDQEHLRLYRMFWHVECALAAHEQGP
ncbi:MAG: hypothetical protein QOG15_2310 [Solirubrobacteraceae bacterium]|nr:hypothetical protein [Solirubrobacteraceae bacterium]